MTDRTVQRSAALWDSGLYCAESVLLACAEELGIQSDLIPRIATGFCGGVSDTCGMCGAVSGAIMAISLAVGRNAPGEPPVAAYTLTRQFLAAFAQEFGSTNCRELTGCDLGTPEGQRAYQENHVAQRCRGYVEGATRIALQLLAERKATQY
jgi:C_GCAxxG_C_C family probable redox protein